MAELTSMMNIGKEMARKLDSVGIGSAEELVRLGAEQAFLKVKERYPNVCLVHLYALEGAVCNVEFNSLSEGRKRELKEFSDFLKSWRQEGKLSGKDVHRIVLGMDYQRKLLGEV